MSSQKQPGRVYYTVLRGSRFLLADERHKMKLLNIIYEMQKKEGWCLYAFCVTDDSAYFISENIGKCSPKYTLKKAASRFLEECRESLPCLDGIEPRLTWESSEELKSLREIAERCRQVHRLPLEEGYVMRIEDYWWSSYITYMGHYHWRMVDCRILFMYFSADPDAARAQIQCFHQENRLLNAV